MKCLQLIWVSTLVACGGLATSESPEPIPTKPAPTVMLPNQVLVTAPEREGCFASKAGSSASANEVRASAGERNVVVSLAIADEKCTGTGGTFVLAREVDSKRVYWMGGHACYPRNPELQQAKILGYAVARTRVTAAVFTISKEQCVAFPGEQDREFSSNEPLQAAAVFSTLAAARAYADSLK
jgi:hypothetical protein